MYKKKMCVQLILIVSVVILLVGCGASETIITATPFPDTPVQPTRKPTPTRWPLPESYIEVTLDNDECTFSGPTELPTGDLVFVLKDKYGDVFWMNVVRLIDGKTYQDLVDYQARPGRYFLPVTWAAGLYEPGSYNSTGGRVFFFKRTIEGEYAVAFGIADSQLWLCGPLQLINSE